MTEEEINLLYELKLKLDVGELTQKEFDDAVAVIRGTKKNAEDTNISESIQESAPAKKEEQDKKKSVIIAAIVAAVVLLALGLFLVLHNSSTKGEEQCTAEMTFPEEDVVQDLIERYCNAICENDFVTLSSIYAPMVERFQDAYNKDRDYVIGCHQRYDKTFKVYNKLSFVRWDSFEMEMLSNGRLSAKVIEDYHIDREDKSKYSVFVLEKHFVIDSTYHIVSVYDNQLSKAKGTDNYNDYDISNSSDDQTLSEGRGYASMGRWRLVPIENEFGEETNNMMARVDFVTYNTVAKKYNAHANILYYPNHGFEIHDIDGLYWGWRTLKVRDDDTGEIVNIRYGTKEVVTNIDCIEIVDPESVKKFYALMNKGNVTLLLDEHNVCRIEQETQGLTEAVRRMGVNDSYSSWH